MTPTDLHDPDLEHRLRTLLADRAATITGPPPALGTGARIGGTLAPVRAGGRGPRGPIRWIAAAAAVAAVALVAVRTVGSDGPTVRTSADPSATTAPAGATSTTAAPTDARADGEGALAPELPDWFVPRLATPLFTAGGEAEDVARSYLADRFGDGVDEAEQQLASDLVFTPTAGPVEGIVALRFDQDGEGLEDLPKGTVFLRSDEGTWFVVAAVTDGLSLASIGREGSTLAGSATGSHADGDNLRSLFLTVSDQADGTTLAEATSSAASPDEPETRVDITADVGEAAARVSVRAAGGRTLAITELVSDPLTFPKALWSGSTEDVDQRQDPESAARAFAASLVNPLPITSIAPTDPYDGRGDAALLLTLEGGVEVTVELAESPGGWVVLDLQDDAGLGPSSSAQMTGPTGTPPIQALRLGIPDTVVSADLTTWGDDGVQSQTLAGAALDAGPDEMHVQPEGMHYARIAFDPPRDFHHSLLVGRDADGTVVNVQTGAWA